MVGRPERLCAAHGCLVRLSRPPIRSTAWLLTMWGSGGVGWDFLQTVSLWFMGVFKLCIWFLFLVVLWLTLWARQLRKLDRQGMK